MTAKSRVFVMGPTGVGKSTLIQFLSGCDFTVENVDGGKRMVATDPSKLLKDFVVSDEFISETQGMTPFSLPKEMYNLQEEVEFVDTPGLFDTSGKETEIKHHIALRAELSKEIPSKFVIMARYDTLMADRGTGMIQLSEQIADVFGGEDAFVVEDDILRSCIVVVTRMDKEASLEKHKENMIALIKKKVKTIVLTKYQGEERKRLRFQQKILNLMVGAKIGVIMLDQERTDRTAFVQEICSKPCVPNGFSYEMNERLRNYLHVKASEELNSLQAQMQGDTKDFVMADKKLQDIRRFHVMSQDQVTEETLKRAEALMHGMEESKMKLIAASMVQIFEKVYDPEEFGKNLHIIGMFKDFRAAANEELSTVINNFHLRITIENFQRFLFVYDDMKKIDLGPVMEQKTITDNLVQMEKSFCNFCDASETEMVALLNETKNMVGKDLITQSEKLFETLNDICGKRIQLRSSELLEKNFLQVSQVLHNIDLKEDEVVMLLTQKLIPECLRSGGYESLQIVEKLPLLEHQKFQAFVEETKVIISKAVEEEIDRMHTEYKDRLKDAATVTSVLPMIANAAQDASLLDLAGKAEAVREEVAKEDRERQKKLIQEKERAEEEARLQRERAEVEIQGLKQAQETQMAEVQNQIREERERYLHEKENAKEEQKKYEERMAAKLKTLEETGSAQAKEFAEKMEAQRKRFEEDQENKEAQRLELEEKNRETVRLMQEQQAAQMKNMLEMQKELTEADAKRQEQILTEMRETSKKEREELSKNFQTQMDTYKMEQEKNRQADREIHAQQIKEEKLERAEERKLMEKRHLDERAKDQQFAQAQLDALEKRRVDDKKEENARHLQEKQEADKRHKEQLEILQKNTRGGPISTLIARWGL